VWVPHLQACCPSGYYQGNPNNPNNSDSPQHGAVLILLLTAMSICMDVYIDIDSAVCSVDGIVVVHAIDSTSSW